MSPEVKEFLDRLQTLQDGLGHPQLDIAQAAVILIVALDARLVQAEADIAALKAKVGL